MRRPWLCPLKHNPQPGDQPRHFLDGGRPWERSFPSWWSTSFPASLSSASLVVEKETQVAAGHVNTQNLGGKKICCTGWVAECFDCCCGKLCGFQNLERPSKTSRFIRVWCGRLPMNKCYIIFAVFKILKTFVHKEIRQLNGAQTF